MHDDAAREAIAQGRAVLGIELGSSRIKSVLIGDDFSPIAAGSHEWENTLADGVWTYRLEDAWTGLQASYRALAGAVWERYGLPLSSLAAIGISGMMHGYLPFDARGRQLAGFRTWRNTMTAQAAERLTERFGLNIPQRWSVAQLYQAMLNGEVHVGEIAHLTTLSGYIHWRLTGRNILGIGEASGMFPVHSGTGGFHPRMLAQFDELVRACGYSWTLEELLPRVMRAGEPAGALTEQGARLLDPTGTLRPGIPLCPPEGDAGTGMVATNSVLPGTGNVSAGTSIFGMMVMDRALARVHPEIDTVSTPAGAPVAMIHCNNGTGDLDAWAGLLGRRRGCWARNLTRRRSTTHCTARRWRGRPTAAACSPTTTSPASTTPAWRRAARC